MARTVSGEVRKIATDKLREAFAEVPEPRLAAPVEARVNGTREPLREKFQEK